MSPSPSALCGQNAGNANSAHHTMAEYPASSSEALGMPKVEIVTDSQPVPPQEAETPASPAYVETDEYEERLYCFCGRGGGEMVGCDGDECTIEWVRGHSHFSMSMSLIGTHSFT